MCDVVAELPRVSCVYMLNAVVRQGLKRRMSTMSSTLLDSFKLTAGQTITCKAAVAWEPKKPLDVTDIQVGSQRQVDKV